MESTEVTTEKAQDMTMCRFRMPSDLMPLVKASAHENQRSFNAEVTNALRRHYEGSPAGLMTDDQRARVDNLRVGAYQITPRSLLERGIELAIQEIERIARQAGGDPNDQIR